MKPVLGAIVQTLLFVACLRDPVTGFLGTGATLLVWVASNVEYDVACEDIATTMLDLKKHMLTLWGVLDEEPNASVTKEIKRMVVADMQAYFQEHPAD